CARVFGVAPNEHMQKHDGWSSSGPPCLLGRDNVASAARFLLRQTFRGRTHDIASAVTPYRSKFSDCSVGTVANSYPNVDLLWDNVIAGLPSWPRNSASCKVPARCYPMRWGGPPYDIPRGGNFHLEMVSLTTA